MRTQACSRLGAAGEQAGSRARGVVITVGVDSGAATVTDRATPVWSDRQGQPQPPPQCYEHAVGRQSGASLARDGPAREPCPLHRRQSRDHTSPSQARQVNKAPTKLYSTMRLPMPTTILLAQLRRGAAPSLREWLVRGPALMLSTSLPSPARPRLPCKACRSFYDRACGKPSCSRCVPCAKHIRAARPLNRPEPGNCSYSRRALLLHRAREPGTVGRETLLQRSRDFLPGRWDSLLGAARAAPGARAATDAADDEAARERRRSLACANVRRGEVSRARVVLTSARDRARHGRDLRRPI